MFSFLAWYLVVSLLGWMSFPLAYRLFPALADRGFSLSRALGLLLWGYIFWLMASLQIVENDLGGLVLALILLAALCAAALLRKTEANGISFDLQPLRDWLRSNRRLVIAVEVLFFLAFAVCAFVRASNPEATTAGGEKVMEVAFINAIMRSPIFPPHDPWLSGYAISYYYFGYVMAAMLAEVTGVLGSIAHNLMLSLIFSLSAVGAYGVLYNLLAVWHGRQSKTFHRKSSTASPQPSLLLSMLGPFFLLIVSNFEGFLEMLHRHGVFWKFNSDGTVTSAFWKWLDIRELNVPPSSPLQWIPDRFIWWWRASRVVQNYDLAGHAVENIDEFPFFSYLLGDLHPHVLAMPFGLLAVAIALNVFLGGWRTNPEEWRVKLNIRTWAWAGLTVGISGLGSVGFGIYYIYRVIQTLSGNGQIESGVIISTVISFLLGIVLIWIGWFILSDFAFLGEHGVRVFIETGLGERAITPSIHLSHSGFTVTALVLGGLAFLNTWDILIGFALFVGAYALARAMEAGWTWKRLEEILILGLPTGLLAILLYLPFYVGFQSQAGGILPNLENPTRGAQLWVMFGALFIPVIAYVIYLWRSEKRPMNWPWGFGLAAALVVFLWLFSWLLAFLIRMFKPDLAQGYLEAQGGFSTALFFSATTIHRLAYTGGWLTLLGLLGTVLALLIPLEKSTQRKKKTTAGNPQSSINNSQPSILNPQSPVLFVLLLTLLAVLLILAPEFVFLRDQFVNRMNTIFKFYYQAWLMMSLAAAFGVAVMLLRLRGSWAWIYRSGMAVVMLAALAYPILSLPNKTYGFQLSAFRQRLAAARQAGDPSPLLTAVQVWTLDGGAAFAERFPDDAAAVRFLRTTPDGIIVEAVGGEYSDFGHIAVYSGLPSVLNWPGHEGQWRGGGEEQGTRQEDIQRLYETRNWDEASAILDQYNIRYVIVGTLERMTYRVYEAKFQGHLQKAFQSGQVVVYEMPTQTDMLK